MDVRREARQIWKHFDGYTTDIGEALVYFKFDAALSAYDRVYDEGYRKYEPGIRIPILWVDQSEATEDYAPEGRRPTQRLRLAVSAFKLHEAGISVTEAHGNRLTDGSPSTVWRYDRVHDIMYYDNRYYEVSAFQIRGRVKGEDVIIGITGIETYPSDDMVFDFAPGTVFPLVPPPEPEPTPTPFSIIPSQMEDPFTYNFGVTDVPGHTVVWDFGDGTTGQSPSEGTLDHTYINPGPYTVDAVCHHELATCSVLIEAPPKPVGYGSKPYGSGSYGGTT